MLDMGFIPDIKRIMALLPSPRSGRTCCSPRRSRNEIKKLADELLNAPQLIEVARRNTAAETVTQSAYKCPQDAKRALLVHIVKSRNVWQVLCFVRTKHGASRLARQLEKDGLATSAIHGDKTQAARLEALSQFKEGKLQVLVATDVAARGLDIDDLPLVVNYELPHVPEDYIHRIGRTGRAGATGEAISLVAPEEEKYLAEIEKLLKKKVTIRLRGRLRHDDHRPRASAAQHDVRALVAQHDVRARRATSERARATPTAQAGEEAPTSTHRRERAPASDARRDPASASAGDTRRAEREAAYAKNPDQPLVKRAAARRGRRGCASARAHSCGAAREACAGAAAEAPHAGAGKGLRDLARGPAWQRPRPAGPSALTLRATVARYGKNCEGHADCEAFTARNCWGHIDYTTNEILLPGGGVVPLPPVSVDFAVVDSGHEILGTPVPPFPGTTGDFVPRFTCRLVKIHD